MSKHFTTKIRILNPTTTTLTYISLDVIMIIINEESLAMYVCLCRGITDSQINKAVDQGCESMRALSQDTGLGQQCGKCVRDARLLMKGRLRDTQKKPGQVAGSEQCVSIFNVTAAR